MQPEKGGSNRNLVSNLQFIVDLKGKASVIWVAEISFEVSSRAWAAGGQPDRTEHFTFQIGCFGRHAKGRPEGVATGENITPDQAHVPGLTQGSQPLLEGCQ